MFDWIKQVNRALAPWKPAPKKSAAPRQAASSPGRYSAPAAPRPRAAAARPTDGGWSDLVSLRGGLTPEKGQPTEKRKKDPKPEAPEEPKTASQDFSSQLVDSILDRATNEDFKDPYDAQQKESARQARAARAKMLGIADGEKPEATSIDTKMLTTEEYNKLNSRQRAAVDYNTILTDAVAKDLSHQDDYADLEGSAASKTYNVAVENMFGKGGGSDLYAPETMAVLRQLKIDDKSADLDDFLGLQAAISEDDLKALDSPADRTHGLTLNPGLTPAEPAPLDRAGYVSSITDRAQSLQEALAKGNEMLQSFSETSLAVRSEETTRFGGEPDKLKIGTGYGPAFGPNNEKTLDGYFQEAFDALGNTANDKDTNEILSVMQSELKPGELDSFFQYADTRSQNSSTYGMELGTTKGTEYRSPEDFRKILGLGE